MDSAPRSVIYFWLIKSARFFSLLCTVCQVHYLLTHKSSSLAKGKFPPGCQAAVSLCHTPHVHGAAPSPAPPRQRRRTRGAPEARLILRRSEEERAKPRSLPRSALPSPAALIPRRPCPRHSGAAWLASPLPPSPTAPLTAPRAVSRAGTTGGAEVPRAGEAHVRAGLSRGAGEFPGERGGNAEQARLRPVLASNGSARSSNPREEACQSKPVTRHQNRPHLSLQTTPRSISRALNLSEGLDSCQSAEIHVPLPFPGVFPIAWDPRSRRDTKGFWSPRLGARREARRGTLSVSVQHHSLTLKPSFRPTWCQQIYQTFCN